MCYLQQNLDLLAFFCGASDDVPPYDEIPDDDGILTQPVSDAFETSYSGTEPMHRNKGTAPLSEPVFHAQ